MEVFKVIFHNNMAIAAEKVDFSFRKSAKVESANNKTYIKWLPVFADSEQESILIANKLANFYFIPKSLKVSLA